MVKINPASGSNNEFPINSAQSEKSPKDIVIFNFYDQNPVGNKKQPYEVKFDKNGYPIPDGENLTTKTYGLFTKKILYMYKSDGKKTYGQIRDMFNLKKEALRKNPNNLGVDEETYPDNGRIIYFYPTDVDIKK